MTATLSEITALIHEKYGIERDVLQPDTPMSEYGLDSLTFVEVLFTLEEHFDVSLPDGRGDIQTLAGLAALIDELRSAKSA